MAEQKVLQKGVLLAPKEVGLKVVSLVDQSVLLMVYL